MVFFDVGDLSEHTDIKESYDMIIVGGGPAGMTAGLYAARGGLNALLIEKTVQGGQMARTQMIENYPGFQQINGSELSDRMKDHASYYGLQFLPGEVTEISINGREKEVSTDEGRKIRAQVLIIATGAEHKKLGVPGEERLEGKGLSYCSICDGPLFSGKDVVVIGGGNSAVDEAIYLSTITNSVTIIHRRDRLRAEKVIQDKAFANSKIRFQWNSIVEEFCGVSKLTHLRIKNKKTNELSELFTDGAFVYVGLAPNSHLVQGIIPLDEDGFIPVDPQTLETQCAGVFAVGDIVKKPIRQIVNAAADGALAATMAIKAYFGEPS